MNDSPVNIINLKLRELAKYSPLKDKHLPLPKDIVVLWDTKDANSVSVIVIGAGSSLTKQKSKPSEYILRKYD